MASWRTNNHDMNKELQKILKYGIVGVSNVLIDVGSFNLLLFLHVNPYIASSLSFIIAATNSYIHNRRWTFSDGKRNVYAQYVQFMVVNATGLLFNNLLIYVFLKYLWLGNLTLTTNVAKLIAVVLVVTWNYGVSRFVVFRPHTT